jgi:hypothetical protein
MVGPLIWAGAGLCLSVALTGYPVGPDVVELLLGGEFRPSSEVAAFVGIALAFAVGEIVALTAMWRVARSTTVQEEAPHVR